MWRNLCCSVLLAAAMLPSYSAAQTRTPAITNLGDWNSSTSILMINNPDGSGTSFDYCYLHDTYQRTSANIRIYVEYANPPFGPITHLNADAWRLVFYNVSPDFTYCSQDVDDTLELLNFFQSVNSPDGIYNIAIPLRAGGSGSASVKLVYHGNPLVELEFGTMHFISTDINGDDHTNLSDVPLFNTMFQSGIYHKAIDFQYDGSINLSDLPYFSSRIGADCS